MRNLKRALSLTLASVMLLGMMVVGSSALSFNDADDISNVTAATVLEELGVMQGDGQGNFMPEQSVTRAQMAILICRILYGDKLNISQFSGTTQYTDVPATEYYTGYINLATQLGIIAGYGDGRFGPDDTVTTAQAALMLSRALGYFKANELAEASDWALASVAQATKINMFGKLNLATNELLARDNVCEMVFNTMTKAVPVMYSERWGVYYTDSQSLMQGVNFNYRDTLAYQNFDLVYDEGKKDDFDRPATEWGTGVIGNGDSYDGIDDKGNIEKGKANIKDSFIVAVNDADETYTSAVKLGDIYKDLGLNESIAAGKVYFYRNGKLEGDLQANNNGKPALSTLGLTKGDDTKIGGNGVLTQVWYGVDNKDATISMIDTYVGEVVSVTNASGSADRYVTLATKNAKPDATVESKFETENFAAKDIVMYTVAQNDNGRYDIQTMELLGSPATGVLTEWNGKSLKGSNDEAYAQNNFTVAGKTYKYSENDVVVDDQGSWLGQDVSGFTVDESEVNVYLDHYGYAIYVSGVEGVTNYAAVIGIGNVNQYGDGADGATLLLPDGTIKTVTFKMKSGQSVTTDLTAGNKVHNNSNLATSKEGWSADIVKYRVLDDGTYELNAQLGGFNKGDTTNYTAVNAIRFVNGKSEFVLDAGADKVDENKLYTTEKTIFFIATKDGNKDGKITYTAYTGYNAAPGIKDTVETNHCIAYVLDSTYTSQINAVYLAYNKMDGVSAVDTYFVKKADAGIVHNSQGDYYVLPAVVGGEITTVKISATITGPIDMTDNANLKGVFAINSVIKDKNDIITGFSNANDTGTPKDDVFHNVDALKGTVATDPAKKVVGVGENGSKTSATYWAYNDSTKFFRVNEDMDKITVMSATGIYDDTNDLVYAKTDDKTKTLQDVFVVDVKNTDSKPAGENEVTINVEIDAGVKSVTVGGTTLTADGTVNVTKSTATDVTVELNPEYKVTGVTGAGNNWTSGEKFTINTSVADTLSIATGSTKGKTLTLIGTLLVGDTAPSGGDGINDKVTVIEGTSTVLKGKIETAVVNGAIVQKAVYSVTPGTAVTIGSGQFDGETSTGSLSYDVDGTMVTINDGNTADTITFTMPTDKDLTLNLTDVKDFKDSKGDTAGAKTAVYVDNRVTGLKWEADNSTTVITPVSEPGTGDKAGFTIYYVNTTTADDWTATCDTINVDGTNDKHGTIITAGTETAASATDIYILPAVEVTLDQGAKVGYKDVANSGTNVNVATGSGIVPGTELKITVDTKTAVTTGEAGAVGNNMVTTDYTYVMPNTELKLVGGYIVTLKDVKMTVGGKTVTSGQVVAELSGVPTVEAVSDKDNLKVIETTGGKIAATAAWTPAAIAADIELGSAVELGALESVSVKYVGAESGIKNDVCGGITDKVLIVPDQVVEITTTKTDASAQLVVTDGTNPVVLTSDAAKTAGVQAYEAANNWVRVKITTAVKGWTFDGES